MKIKFVIRSILFSFLILPLLAIGQSPNDETMPLFFPYVESHTYQIKPNGTYLLTSGEYNLSVATNISLYNIKQKTDIIHLLTSGSFSYNPHGAQANFALGMLADTRAAPVNYGPNSDANIDVVSIPTYIGNHKTDISQDFLISNQPGQCTKIEIPEKALWLFFSPHDAFFSDNSDTDGDFKAHVHLIHEGARVGYSNPVQVITAPQLERDEGTGLTHHYDNDSSYDLVANKPFMVRAGFHKLYQDADLSNNTRVMFNPVLKIQKKEDGKYVDVSSLSYTCVGEDDSESKDNCMFEGSEFEVFKQPRTELDGTKYYGGTGREFRIAGGLPAGSYKITVSLDFNSNVPCERFKDGILPSSFEVEVHETHSPRIGLARVNCDQLDQPNTAEKDKCTVDDNVMFNFLNNNKEIDFFERFFPVTENDKKFFRAEYTSDDGSKMELKPLFDLISPENPKEEDLEDRLDQESILLALQAKKLSSHKLLFRYNYLVGIGSKVFFTKKSQGLNLSDAVGVAFVNLQAPFDRVAFVRDKAVNTGTLLHELGHLLGQNKDFYQKGYTDSNNNFIPLSDSEQSQCTGHDLKLREQDNSFDKTSFPCHTFPRQNQSEYANYDFKNSEFISGPQSIMGGSTKLDEQIMDRDTYIATFNHLIEPPKDPKITLISGIYAKGKMFDTKVSHHGAGMLHPLSDEGDLHIMLKDSSDQMLVETKVPSAFEYEALKVGGGEHVSVSDLAPIVVAFPYQEKAVKAVIMKKEKGGTETMIFSQALPIDSKPQHLFSSNHSRSTEENFPMLEQTHKVELLKKKAVKATSSVFTKFMYSPAFEMSFGYNACSDKLLSGSGISLLLGKDPKDYRRNRLVRGNQGVKFNNKGLSLHLSMNEMIQLKDGGGQTLAMANHAVKTDCNKWKVLKLAIDENNKLTLKQKNKTLLSHDLTLEQIEEIASQPIGFNAFSKEKGQYGVRHVTLKALLPGEENTEQEEE